MLPRGDSETGGRAEVAGSLEKRWEAGEWGVGVGETEKWAVGTEAGGLWD